MTVESKPHGCEGASRVDIWGRDSSEEGLQRPGVGAHLGGARLPV